MNINLNQLSPIYNILFLKDKIAETAYFKAEKRNFMPGFEANDWFESELEVLSLYLVHDN